MPAFRNTTPTVDAIDEINFVGNVIPHTWYQHFKLESGLTDLVAITLLGEIVFWYRPFYEQNESTGELVAIRKKFQKDKLQRSIDALAKKFGMTYRQVKDALFRLEKTYGVITRQRRSEEIAEGITAHQVLFLEPIPEKIRAITHQRQDGDATASAARRHSVSSPTPQRQHTEILREENNTKREEGDLSPLPSFEGQNDAQINCLAEEIAPIQTGESPPEKLTPLQLIAMYNDLTPPTHPKIHNKSDGRIATARQYLKQFPERSFWETVFGNISTSAFLQGKNNGNGHETFVADFEWLLSKGKNRRTENCLKVFEGAYADKNGGGIPSNETQTAEDRTTLLQELNAGLTLRRNPYASR